MSFNKDDVLETLKNSYHHILKSISDKLGVIPELLPEIVENNENSEMIAAMIGISGAGIKGTASVIADKPVVFGSYGQAYADFSNHSDGYDTIELFGEFADMLTQSAVEHAEISGLWTTPAQVIEGKNFKNLPAKKRSVKSFSMPFRLPDGMLYINTSIYM